MQELIENLQSVEEADRIYAAEDLADLGSPDAAIPLAHRLIVEESVAVKNTIVAALQQVDISQVHELIFEMFMSTDAFLRNAAVMIFGAGGEEAVAFLTSLLDHSNPEVRKLVLDAMFEVGSDETLLVIRAGLFDESVNVQITAVEYLGRLGDSAGVPDMLTIFEESDEPMLRAAILETMAMVADAAAITGILDVLIPEGGSTKIDPVYLAGLTELTARAGEREAIARLAASITDVELYGEEMIAMLTIGLKRFADLLADRVLLDLVLAVIHDRQANSKVRHQAADCLLKGRDGADLDMSMLVKTGRLLIENEDTSLTLPAVRLLAAAGELTLVRETMESRDDDDLRELCEELLSGNAEG